MGLNRPWAGWDCSFCNRFSTIYAKKICFSHYLMNQFLKYIACVSTDPFENPDVSQNLSITQREGVSMTHSSFQMSMKKIDHQSCDTTSVFYVTVHNGLRAKKENCCFIGIARFCSLEVCNSFSEFFRYFTSFHFLWTRWNDLFISNRENIRSQVLCCLVSSVAK